MVRVTPEQLRPYTFHGVNLQQPDSKESVGDCPFCGKEIHFYIEVATGKWHCKSCGDSGNAVTFLRKLWKLSDENTTDYIDLAEDRKLLFPETVMHWGCARSILTRKWLIPGYNSKAKLCQLYQYVETAKGKQLLPTPTMGHQLHGVNLYKSKPQVFLCEGPWDGMVLWEMLAHAKPDAEGNLVTTSNQDASLLSDANVLAVPGCTVFSKNWLPLFFGKVVNLMYDNDHPCKHPKTGKTIQPAGYHGMVRVAGILSAAKKPPTEIKYLKWEELGNA